MDVKGSAQEVDGQDKVGGERLAAGGYDSSQAAGVSDLATSFDISKSTPAELQLEEFFSDLHTSGLLSPREAAKAGGGGGSGAAAAADTSPPVDAAASAAQHQEQVVGQGGAEGRAAASDRGTEVQEEGVAADQKGEGEGEKADGASSDGPPWPWEAVADGESGSTYYWNTETGETSWEFPGVGDPVSQPPTGASPEEEAAGASAGETEAGAEEPTREGDGSAVREVAAEAVHGFIQEEGVHATGEQKAEHSTMMITGEGSFRGEAAPPAGRDTGVENAEETETGAMEGAREGEHWDKQQQEQHAKRALIDNLRQLEHAVQQWHGEFEKAAAVLQQKMERAASKKGEEERESLMAEVRIRTADCLRLQEWLREREVQVGGSDQGKGQVDTDSTDEGGCGRFGWMLRKRGESASGGQGGPSSAGLCWELVAGAFAALFEGSLRRVESASAESAGGGGGGNRASHQRQRGEEGVSGVAKGQAVKMAEAGRRADEDDEEPETRAVLSGAAHADCSSDSSAGEEGEIEKEGEGREGGDEEERRGRDHMEGHGSREAAGAAGENGEGAGREQGEEGIDDMDVEMEVEGQGEGAAGDAAHVAGPHADATASSMHHWFDPHSGTWVVAYGDHQQQQQQQHYPGFWGYGTEEAAAAAGYVGGAWGPAIPAPPGDYPVPSPPPSLSPPPPPPPGVPGYPVSEEPPPPPPLPPTPPPEYAEDAAAAATPPPPPVAPHASEVAYPPDSELLLQQQYLHHPQYHAAAAAPFPASFVVAEHFSAAAASPGAAAAPAVYASAAVLRGSQGHGEEDFDSTAAVAAAPVSAPLDGATGGQIKGVQKKKAVKRKAVSASAGGFSVKKVSSLVQKWAAVKETMKEEEESEVNETEEQREVKKKKEIEDWKVQQIISGQAVVNPNFQPLGSKDGAKPSWRDRVKKAKKPVQ